MKIYKIFIAKICFLNDDIENWLARIIITSNDYSYIKFQFAILCIVEYFNVMFWNKNVAEIDRIVQFLFMDDHLFVSMPQSI